MADEDRYQVFTARDDVQNLKEVLQFVGSQKNHVQIVSITWQSPRQDEVGNTRLAGYTIVAEVEV